MTKLSILSDTKDKKERGESRAKSAKFANRQLSFCQKYPIYYYTSITLISLPLKLVMFVANCAL